MQRVQSTTLRRLAQNRAEQVAFSRFLHHPEVHLDQLLHAVTQSGQAQVLASGHRHILIRTALSWTKRHLLGLSAYRAILPRGANPLLCQKRPLIYAWIKEHREQFNLELMCKTMGVSRSGFYDWQRSGPARNVPQLGQDRPLSTHDQEDQTLMKTIKTIHAKSRGTHGTVLGRTELS